MLRITMSESGEAATKYFDRALATADYYAKDPGLWAGKGTEMLGLSDAVSRDDFIALAANKVLAVNHLFERSSVVRELHAVGMLLRRGIGRVSVDQAKAFAAQDARFVRPYGGAGVMTTREVLHEETEMLKIVEAGGDRYEEIGPRRWLGAPRSDQRRAEGSR
jgi:TrwC relaxase